MVDLLMLSNYNYPSYFHFLMDSIKVEQATPIHISYPNGNGPIYISPSTIPNTSSPTSCILFNVIKSFITVLGLWLQNASNVYHQMAHNNLSSSILCDMGSLPCTFLKWHTSHWKILIKWSPDIHQECVVLLSTTRWLASSTSTLAVNLSIGCHT